MSKPSTPVNPLSVQVAGDHYKSMPMQPIEFCMANNLDACQSAVIKYVTRFRAKGGIEDLNKAKHYLDLLIEFEGRKPKAGQRVKA